MGEEMRVTNRVTVMTMMMMTCQTANLIYIIFCRGCGKSYIGETGEALVVIGLRSSTPATELLKSAITSLSVGAVTERGRLHSV